MSAFLYFKLFAMSEKLSNPWQLISLLLVGLIAGYGYGMSQLSGASPSTESLAVTVTANDTTGDGGLTDDGEVVKIDLDDDTGLGNPDAPVQMVEFSDFQCPYCRKFYNETFAQLKENYIDKDLVYFVYRDFPLSIHSDAQKAAEATECADDQGEFWEMHDLIFEGQNKLGSGTVDIPLESLKSYAKELLLDTDAFNECIDSGKYADEVAADIQDAIRYGVSATPTFFINGLKIVGAQSYSTISSTIDSLL
jgi:protein-disulfide isomerase